MTSKLRLTAAAISFIVSAYPAQAQNRQFDIASQPATTGIEALGAATGLQIVAAEADLRGINIAPVKGAMSPREAVRRALAGTGLDVVSENDRTLVVKRVPLDDAAAEAPDTIVVTGSALQSRSEVATRRKATAIVDTLARDEIGSFPDITIAESLRRITGVTTIYNDDIGQFASIRGTHPDFIPVTLNGLMLATTGDLGEGTRRVNLQVIPGDAVRQLQAFKSMSPDLDAGALGGLIDIVTISAFDPNRSTFSLTGGASWSSYMKVPDTNSGGDRKDSPFGPSISAMWAPRFGANHEFGLAVTGFYEVRPRTQSNDAIVNRLYYTDAGVATTPESANWNGVAAPDSFVSHNYTNKFTKYGATARLEYKPSESFYTSLFGFAYFSKEQETRNTNRVFSLDQPQNLTETTGSMRVRSSDVQWRYNTFQRDQRGLQWKTQADIGERGKLSADVGYSYAWFKSDRPFVSFIYRPNTRLTYDLSNPDQRFVLDNAAAYTNPANFRTNSLYRDQREATENMYEARLDYKFNSGINDRGFGFAAGGDYRSFDLTRDNTAVYYTVGTASMSGVSFIPDFDLPGYSNPGLWLDQKKFWNEIVPTIPVDVAQSDRQSRLNDYRYEEKVASGYVNLTHSSDALRLDAGLRLDHTDYTAFMAEVIDGALQPEQRRVEGSYTNVLPYFTGVYSVTPNMRIKATASRTLGRPNPESIATVEEVDRTDLTISRGNPEIKPRKSTNLDLGFEYYFNRGRGMVTLTGFYKNIDDDILNVTTTEVIDGDTYEVSQPINGNKTKYKGVEFGFTNSGFGEVAGFLEPVGASLNMVWIKGESSFPYNGVLRKQDQLQFQSDFAANAALFYSFGTGSEVRLAMNHQGRYLEEFAALPWQNIYIAPFTTFDLTASWAFLPNAQLRLEGRNILSANRKRQTGLDAKYYRAGLEVGSSVFVRLNVHF
jgi:iron complex outermembrane recepter protein